MAERNFENRTLYHGDNLAFLRGMNSETVNLIATDPPFNKSRDFHATPDSLAKGASFQDRWRWDEDVHDDWLIAIQRDEPEVWQVITAAKQVWGDDMAAFLCWLGVRLLEMHRILTDDGSLYLHIDHTAHAWVKCLLDAIFDRRNFRNEIVWCYAGGGSPEWTSPASTIPSSATRNQTDTRSIKMTCECLMTPIIRRRFSPAAIPAHRGERIGPMNAARWWRIGGATSPGPTAMTIPATRHKSRWPFTSASSLPAATALMTWFWTRFAAAPRRRLRLNDWSGNG